ncbi:restriction endonuclease subunit S [Microbacterium sp. NPDC003461]
MRAVTLGGLVSIRKGRKPGLIREYRQDGDARLLQVADLRGDAVARFTRPTADAVFARKDDVLLAWDGANAGVSASGLEGVVGSTIGVLRVNDSGAVAPAYLAWFVRSAEYSLRARAKGATIPHVDPAVLRALRVPLPSIIEQRRIAAILDAADGIRAKRRAQLAHLDDLPRAMFREMFGALSADAVVADVLAATRDAIRTGPFGSQLLHEEFVDEGIAVLGLDNVVSDEFRWGARRFITPEKYAQLRRYTVKPGDVLISIMGTTGRCAIVPADIPTAINTKHICALTLATDVALPQFVRAAFLWHPASRRYLMRETKGAIMAGLNMGIIKRMPLPLPSLAAQQEFAAKVEAIHAERARVARALEADDELFAALQHRAFRGEL